MFTALTTHACHYKGRFLGANCRRSMKNSLFLYLVLCAQRSQSVAARIKLREAKNFSRYACNLRLMETSRKYKKKWERCRKKSFNRFKIEHNAPGISARNHLHRASACGVRRCRSTTHSALEAWSPFWDLLRRVIGCNKIRITRTRGKSAIRPIGPLTQHTVLLARQITGPPRRRLELLKHAHIDVSHHRALL